MYKKIKLINKFINDYLKEKKISYSSITIDDYIKIIDDKKINDYFEKIFYNIKKINENDIYYCDDVVKNIISIFFENTNRIIEEKASNEDYICLLTGLKAYINDIEKYPVLSNEEQIKLINDYKINNNINSRDKLIYCNQRLILKYVFKKTNDEQLMLDMIQEGNIGLMKGIDNFNIDFNCRISTYIYMWIKSYIDLKFYEKELIRKPHHTVFFEYKILNYIEYVKEAENRNPSKEELCKKFKISNTRLEDILFDNSSYSLNVLVGEDSDDELMDFLEDKKNFVYETDDKYYIKEVIEKMKNVLIPSMVEVVVLRLGLIDDVPKTFEEISRLKGVSKQAIEVRYNSALKKLQKSPEIKQLFNK